jgi:signal transduction histidine kinase
MMMVRQSAAIDQNLGITQYQHTSWTIGVGAPPDIWDIAQSPDGYLWLATGEGVYRFDGVNFERIRPKNGVEFFSLDITAITACPSGDIWFGYFDGGAGLIRKNRLTNFGPQNGIPPGRVYSVACDRRNRIWAASRSGLYRYDGASWKQLAEDPGHPEQRADYLLVSHDGTLWVTTGTSLIYLLPGEKRFRVALATLSAIAPLAESPNGSIWISDALRGVFPAAQIAKGRWVLLPVPVVDASNDIVRAKRLLFDHDGDLWGTDADHGGIFRAGRPDPLMGAIHQQDVKDRFSQSDGLAANIAVPLFEDDEKDIWVGTNLGLDRFRKADFHSVDGIPTYTSRGYSIAAAEDGSLLVSDADNMFRVKGDRPAEVVARMPPHLLDEYQSSHGYAWILLRDPKSGRLSLVQLDRSGTRTMLIAAQQPSTVVAFMGETPDGSMLARFDNSPMLLYRDGEWRHQPTGSALPAELIRAIATDALGRMCFGYYKDLLTCILDGHTNSFTQRDGLKFGTVTAICPDGPRLLLGGEFGLGEVLGGHIRAVTTNRAPAFTGITGIIRSRDGAIWLNGMMGIVRITPGEFNRALDDQSYEPKYRLYDYHDNVDGTAQQGDVKPTAAETADGRLWFVTNHGIVTTDPAQLIRSARPPGVFITSMTADNETFSGDALTLTAGIKNLRIDYTALSLSSPERLRFFYKLEGFDRSWVEAGSRRQAFYTNLPPGRYRFLMTAANGEGARNPLNAAVTFEIPPTFVQSGIFVLLCTAGAALLLWAVYSYRMDQMASHVRIGLEERLRERERIARELHDTLLQGVQGLIMRFQAIMHQIPGGTPLQAQMELALDRADQVLVDGRDRVRNLRLADEYTDVAGYLEQIGKELAVNHSSTFRIVVEGTPRTLHAVVYDELRWIGREAVFNAFHHSQARLIEVEIGYHWLALRLRVRDNGAGLPADVVAAGRRDGHYGIVGMRERADRVSGKFRLLSTPGNGTELSVTICPSVAYVRPTYASAWQRLRRLIFAEIRR